MVCEKYSSALNDTAAGALPSVGFDAHLSVCADCRARLAVLRRVLAAADREMAQWVKAEPSASFMPRLRAALDESGAAPVWRAGWFRSSIAAAAAVVLVALALVLARRLPQEQPPIIATQIASPPATVRPPEVPGVPVAADAMEREREAPQSSHRRSRPRAPSEAEVLVPAGTAQAVRQLVAAVNSGRPVPPTLADTDHASAAPVALPPIDIKPIEIVPLDRVGNPGT